MFTQANNFRSPTVNTDGFGFRFNDINNISKNVINESNLSNEKNIICGGSFGFGTGATKDENTISALLSKNSTQTLNLSGSAFVGFQDIITLISNINSLKSIKKLLFLPELAIYI